MNTAVEKPGRLRRIATSRPLLIGVILVGLYALCGFVLAPWLIRQQLPELAEKHLGAQVSVSAVRLNPFLLTLEATDLSVAEKNSAPALKIGRVFVNLEIESLLRRAWIFSQVAIDRPVVAADLNAQQSLNLVRLLALKPGKPAPANPAPAGRPRFLLQHFALTGGDFSYTDRTVQPAAHARFNPVSFEVQDVSTLPDLRGEHRLNARLPGGGNLQWRGELTLEPFDSSGSITIKDAKLATLWRFVQGELAIAEPSGAYDLGLNYRVRDDRGSYVLQADRLALQLKDLGITQKKGGATLARLATLNLADGNLDLRKRTLSFKEVQLGKGEIHVVVDREGTPDWATLITTAGEKPAGTPAKPAAPWQISLPKIGIGPLALSITDYSRVQPLRIDVAAAEAGLGVTAATGAGAQVSVSDVNLKTSDLRLRSGDSADAMISLGAAELSNGAYELQDRTVRATLLRLSGGRTLITRNAGGQIDLLAAFTARREKPAAPDAGIRVALDGLEIAGHSIALRDRSVTPATTYDLENVRATAGNFAVPFNKTMPVELAFSVKQGGKAQVGGRVDGQGATAELRLDATDIALQPLDSMLRQYTGLTLTAGKAGAAGRVTWNGKNSPATMRFTGSAAIADVDLKSATSGEQLISWQNLAVREIDFNSAENRLAIAQVGLARPYTRLVINKNRTTNLSDALQPRTTPPAAVKPAAQTAAPLAVSIDRVGIERGAMDFTDLSLVLPFSTNIKALGGSVSGLSSATDARASLQFEGRVAEFGLARAEGTVQPFTPKKFTDVTVTFRNVALPPLSPYTATFAGRTIASGKLSLDLEYKLENGQLAGDNKVLLEQLKLGDRVESPGALDLPLDLAVALLTDSAGNINLTVPVKGNVDSPEFDYGQVIAQAIGSAITGIVTAPFRALGAIFGSDAQELGDIVFDPGSARILPTEYEKVRRLAEGLEKRPQLKLMVQGRYHSESDRKALRTRIARAALAEREGLTLSQREDPGPVGYANAKTQRALEILFEQNAGGAAAVADFVAAFRKEAGREVNRVNPLLAATGRGAGDAALYEAMYQRLIDGQALPPDALADLARSRAAAITNALVKRFKLEPARIGASPVAATDDVTDKGVPVTLSFAPVK